MILWLVVEPTPLKNMNLSVGMMTFPKWENKKCSKPPTSEMWSLLAKQPLENKRHWSFTHRHWRFTS